MGQTLYDTCACACAYDLESCSSAPKICRARRDAVGALDPNHTTAPQDMTKVQLPHHHGDFHFA